MAPSGAVTHCIVCTDAPYEPSIIPTINPTIAPNAIDASIAIRFRQANDHHALIALFHVTLSSIYPLVVFMANHPECPLALAYCAQPHINNPRPTNMTNNPAPTCTGSSGVRQHPSDNLDNYADTNGDICLPLVTSRHD